MKAGCRQLVEDEWREKAHSLDTHHNTALLCSCQRDESQRKGDTYTKGCMTF